jgi:site-specific recombinase XerD
MEDMSLEVTEKYSSWMPPDTRSRLQCSSDCSEKLFTRTERSFKREQIGLEETRKFAQRLIQDGLDSGRSPDTCKQREIVLGKLIWFMEFYKISHLSNAVLKKYFVYLRTAHLDPQGRFGNPRCNSPLAEASIKAVHTVIGVFTKALVAYGALEINLIDGIEPPRCPKEEKQPVSVDARRRMAEAAKHSEHALRDFAVALVLQDSGIRASELTSARVGNFDYSNGTLLVRGKGGKYRTVPLGEAARRALYRYLVTRQWTKDSPLFLSERDGHPLTRSGLTQLLQRLAKRAGVTEKVGPHTFRRAFAVDWLRNGGNLFTLQAIMGHCDLATTKKYVAVSQADIINQHRQFSPADRIFADDGPRPTQALTTGQSQYEKRRSHKSDFYQRMRGGMRSVTEP